MNPSAVMYRKILVALEATPTDRAIVDHIKVLAKHLESHLILLHVATGWAARRYGADAVSPEIHDDRTYLGQIRDEFRGAGISVEAELAYGEPAEEIVRCATERECDLIAMSTHGHKFIADVFLGHTAHRVQHDVHIPVLLLRAKK